MAVHATSNAIIATTDERDAVLYGPEDRIGEVLPLLGALAEPAIVGEVHEKVDIILRGLPGGGGEGVFKANERGQFDLAGERGITDSDDVVGGVEGVISSGGGLIDFKGDRTGTGRPA